VAEKRWRGGKGAEHAAELGRQRSVQVTRATPAAHWLVRNASCPQHLSSCSLLPALSVMKIAILQFAPRLGKPEENVQHAESIMASHRTQLTGIEWLVLPELAFSGTPAYCDVLSP
jgi:hypothetical protein